MTFEEVVRLWFIIIWGLSIIGGLGAFFRFRAQREDVERQVGPLPTPMGILQIVTFVILLTGVGEIAVGNSAPWLFTRLVGVGFSIYSLGMLVWAARTLGRFGAPGPAVFHDHELITTGPYRLVRHPGYSAVQAIVLGTALGTLNWLILTLWPVAIAATHFNARAEERLLGDKFGTVYDEYSQETNRFIPATR